MAYFVWSLFAGNDTIAEKHNWWISRLEINTTSVTEENFDTLHHIWTDPRLRLEWPNIFVLPPWLETWWRSFGGENSLWIRAVSCSNRVIGVAPLQFRDGYALFIGSPDVCDYADFIVEPGYEAVFYRALAEELQKDRISCLDLNAMRPDASASAVLPAQRGRCDLPEVSLELELPATWDAYLQLLSRKQRHEVRRKLRRLEEAGRFLFRVLEGCGSIMANLELFFDLFTRSRFDKSQFMSEDMAHFFRRMAAVMAQAGLLKMGVLDLYGRTVAMVLFFDYNGRFYLYNSGYDPDKASLSVGLLSKVLLVKEAIARGRKYFDFLKGGEQYKYRLGGKEVRLWCYRGRIGVTGSRAK